ncbi:MAG: hypothetical protein ACK4GT_14020 [Pararhodobacter sp.]
MRRILAALAMAALLAGCQLSAPAQPVPEDIAGQTVEDGAEADAESPSASPSAGPPAELPAPPEPAAPVAEIPPPPPEPPMLAQQRATCRDNGGQLMPRAPGLYACVRQTRDAGRSCDEGSDCQGLCLARSATCAPLAPLFGCHEVFTTRNRRETLCTD